MCKVFWCKWVEPNSEKLMKLMGMKNNSNYTLIRLCKKLTQRMSKTDDSSFCGQVRLPPPPFSVAVWLLVLFVPLAVLARSRFLSPTLLDTRVCPRFFCRPCVLPFRRRVCGVVLHPINSGTGQLPSSTLVYLVVLAGMNVVRNPCRSHVFCATTSY